MFFALSFISGFIDVFYFFIWASSGFKNFQYLSCFISFLITTIVLGNLSYLSDKVKRNSQEIKRLKKHLGIEDNPKGKTKEKAEEKPEKQTEESNEKNDG